MQTYTINPLQWERGSAYTPFGSFTVFKTSEGNYRWSYCFDECYDEDEGYCRRLKDRMLDCLLPSAGCDHPASYCEVCQAEQA